MGFGLSRGFGAPDWRVLAGVRISDHEQESEAPVVVDHGHSAGTRLRDFSGFADPHDPRAAFFVHTAGGAVKRVGELDTAFPHRNAETMLVFTGGWESAEDDAGGIQAIRDWYYALEPHTGGYYTNIDNDHTSSNKNYGPAYPRLQTLKAQYDPGNLFRLNSNIEPA